MSLNAENCMQNVEKIKSFVVAFLFHKMERFAYIS